MKIELKKILVCGVALGIASAGFAQNDATKAMVGKPAPKFSMKDLKGKTHTNASLKGKVVLLDLWASWCTPCIAASPAMESLHTKYASKGLVVVGVNSLEEDVSKESTAKYQKKHGYKYTFTYDNKKLTDALKVEGIPLFVLIDKKGKISYVSTGIPSKGGVAKLQSDLDSEIKKLLAG